MVRLSKSQHFVKMRHPGEKHRRYLPYASSWHVKAHRRHRTVRAFNKLKRSRIARSDKRMYKGVGKAKLVQGRVHKVKLLTGLERGRVPQVEDLSD
jgi:hypothetical protein